jgi:hypothetical protein
MLKGSPFGTLERCVHVWNICHFKSPADSGSMVSIHIRLVSPPSNLASVHAPRNAAFVQARLPRKFSVLNLESNGEKVTSDFEARKLNPLNAGLYIPPRTLPH